MNYRQLLIAQFGKGSERRLSLSMLVDPGELPGDGWNIKGGTSWRIGKDGQHDAASLRARKRGSFAAMRTFEQQNSSRWVLVKVIPMASSEDALLALPNTNLNLVTKGKSNAVIGAEGSVSLDVDMGLSNAKAIEMSVSGSNETAKYRYVVGTVDRVISLICCVGLEEGWSWQEIQMVTAAQVRKIRDVIASPLNE